MIRAHKRRTLRIAVLQYFRTHVWHSRYLGVPPALTSGVRLHI